MTERLEVRLEPHHSARAGLSRCRFCGCVGVGWWDCVSCEWAQKIRDGKLPRPKMVLRNGVPFIECCDELRAAARLANVNKPDNPVNKSARRANKPAVNRPDVNSSTGDAVNRRREYMKEYMRRRRAKDQGK